MNYNHDSDSLSLPLAIYEADASRADELDARAALDAAIQYEREEMEDRLARKQRPPEPPRSNVIEFGPLGQGQSLGGMAVAAHPPQPAQAEQGARQAPKFRFLRRSQLARGSTADGPIPRFFPRGAVCLLFGESSGGKSLVAIDIACSVATGEPWAGNKTKRGVAAYIQGEGSQMGTDERIAAWERLHGTDAPDTHLFVSEMEAALRAKTSVGEVIAAIGELPEPPALVVIDTLHANFGPGDENSANDMGEFLAGVRSIQAAAPGCCIVIVHHPGHAEKQRARGSYALHAALDVEYRLSGEDVRELCCTKMRDGEKPQPINFKMDMQTLPWLDPDGEIIRAPILVRTDKKPKAETKPLAPTYRELMDAMEIALEECGQIRVINHPEATTLRTGQKSVSKEELRAIYYRTSAADGANAKRTRFNKAVQVLRTLRTLGYSEPYLWKIQ